jgi:hypothetical protein
VRIERDEPLGLPGVDLGTRLRRSIESILDPDQDSVLFEVLAGGEGGR